MEVAGLTVSIIGLAALVEQCIKLAKTVEAGVECGIESRITTYEVTLLSQRLIRYKAAVQKPGLLVGDLPDIKTMGEILTIIGAQLEKAVKICARYATTGSAAPSTASAVAHADAPLDVQLEAKDTMSKPSMPLAKKLRWAIWDQVKLKEKSDSLASLMDKMEAAYPRLQVEVQAMAERDAIALVRLDGCAQDVVRLARSAASNVDRTLYERMVQASHDFQQIEARDNAQINNGNAYLDGWVRAGGKVGVGGSHKYRGIVASGNALVQNGDVFGGDRIAFARVGGRSG